MTPPRGIAVAHPPEGEMARLLDGQLDEVRRQRVQKHLRGCPRCADRLRRLEVPSRLLTEALDAVPTQLPDDSRRALALSAMERASRRTPAVARVWLLRAAAIIPLLMVVVVSARPSRAWINRNIERVSAELGVPTVLQWLTGPAEPPAAAPVRSGRAPGAQAAVAGPAPVDERLRVAAAPPSITQRAGADRNTRSESLPFSSHRELVLEFDTFQVEGTLSLWITADPEGAAVMIGGDRGERIEHARSGLRVRNHGVSTARYELVVPRGVENVRIRIAGEPKAWIGIEPVVNGQPWLWTVDLQRRKAAR